MHTQEVKPELGQAFLGGHVERDEGQRVDLAGDVEAMPRLEAAEAGIHVGVERVVDPAGVFHVAARHQAALDVADGIVGRAGDQADGVACQGAPAAALDDLFVLENGQFEIIGRVEAQDRLIGVDRLEAATVLPSRSVLASASARFMFAKTSSSARTRAAIAAKAPALKPANTSRRFIWEIPLAIWPSTSREKNANGRLFTIHHQHGNRAHPFL